MLRCAPMLMSSCQTPQVVVVTVVTRCTWWARCYVAALFASRCAKVVEEGERETGIYPNGARRRNITTGLGSK